MSMLVVQYLEQQWNWRSAKVCLHYNETYDFLKKGHPLISGSQLWGHPSGLGATPPLFRALELEGRNPLNMLIDKARYSSSAVCPGGSAPCLQVVARPVRGQSALPPGHTALLSHQTGRASLISNHQSVVPKVCIIKCCYLHYAFKFFTLKLSGTSKLASRCAKKSDFYC